MGQDGIGSVVNLSRRNVIRGQRQQQDRSIRRIDLAVVGLARKIGGELAASGVDGRLNVARGGVDIAVEIELKSDARGAEAARGSHLRDPGNAAELPLERRSDCGGHGFRARAGQTGANGDGWKINLRERRDRQETKRNDTGEQNRNGNQRRGNRPSDERRRKIGGEMHRSISVRRFFNWIADVKRETARQPIEGEVNDRRGVKRQQLAEKKAANDGDAQWTAQFRPNTGTESKRQAAEQRGHCRHHDGPEAQ